jgi:hypothetical protein
MEFEKSRIVFLIAFRCRLAALGSDPGDGVNNVWTSGAAR